MHIYCISLYPHEHDTQQWNVEAPAMNDYRKSPLHTAAMRRNEQLILCTFTFLLDRWQAFRNVLVTQKDEFENNLLYYLVVFENVRCLRRILNYMEEGNAELIQAEDFDEKMQKGVTLNTMLDPPSVKGDTSSKSTKENEEGSMCKEKENKEDGSKGTTTTTSTTLTRKRKGQGKGTLGRLARGP